MQNSIEVHKLKKSYEGYEAVRNISFTVKKGEIFAFLGPNGAGKSTTISILSTLMEFDAGSIHIEGMRLGFDNAQIRQTLGIVFQGSMLDETLSVKQNLILRCGLYQLYGKQAKERVLTLSRQCQLDSYLHKKVKDLSGGMRRKVDIARALIPEPQLLILDEPSAGLDPKMRKELWELIKILHDEKGITVFMTTHYMEECEIADHICILNQGHILVDGLKEELIERYHKDTLLVYTDTINYVVKALQHKRIEATPCGSYIRVPIQNFFQLMSILRCVERYIHHVELRKGSLEDVYLNILKEEEKCE